MSLLVYSTLKSLVNMGVRISGHISRAAAIIRWLTRMCRLHRYALEHAMCRSHGERGINLTRNNDLIIDMQIFTNYTTSFIHFVKGKQPAIFFG